MSKRLQSTVPPSKRQRKTEKTKACVKSEYMCDSFRKKFQDSYVSDKENKIDGSEAEIINKPFKCGILPNFIDDDSFFTRLEDELCDLNLNEKNNDLYKFHQSDDLKSVSSPAVSALKNLLYGEFRMWLQEITGIALNETVDMNCSRYEYTDVLLCHDDELEGRRIAYILYLVSSTWCEKDGGTLDLFDTDDNGQPNTVLRSLIPKRNNLVFFEVTPCSFHQVSEVLSESRSRLSVSGWFHGSPIERPLPFLEPGKRLHDPGFIEKDRFCSWINPLYLEKETQIQIQEKFQADSEIELHGFLQEDKYEQLAESLHKAGTPWKINGPANKRHFEETSETVFPEIVQEFLHVIGSEAMFLVLSNMTGLHLHRLYESDSSSEEDEDPEPKVYNPKFRSAIRQWSAGSYTLIHDDDKSHAETALDATLYFNCQEWNPEYGGSTSYIAKGEDEVLLCIHPKPNALALVYRDPETLKFVKHINNRVSERPKENRRFQDICCVYYE